MNPHETIRDAIAAHAAELKGLAQRVHANPELAFEERKACSWQAEILKGWGFEVETPFVGLSTAYRASRGEGGAVLCYMAEYDALPGVGHGCGHNLICTVALGAGVALAECLGTEGAPGTVVVMGTPGEEGPGGKIVMLEKGALSGVDAALMAHPGAKTQIDGGGLGMARFDVSFAGQSAHAAASPEKGRNALDAVMLLFQGVNAWRQHLPEAARVHGIVTEGGEAPNIVPDRAACSFYVRAADEAFQREMEKRFDDIARGAALMTGTQLQLAARERPYVPGRPNMAFCEEYIREAEELGMDPVPLERPCRGSTDFGNVSHLLPGAHVHFAIAKEELASHSPQFAEAAKTDYATSQALRAAEALARVGYRYCTDEGFRTKVAEEFKRGKAD